MVFGDTLVANDDRHSGNIKFGLDRRGEIGKLMSLFDHNMSFGNYDIKADSADSIYKWNNTRGVMSLFEVLQSASKDYSGYLKEYLVKLNTKDFDKLLLHPDVIKYAGFLCNRRTAIIRLLP